MSQEKVHERNDFFESLPREEIRCFQIIFALFPQIQVVTDSQK